MCFAELKARCAGSGLGDERICNPDIADGLSQRNLRAMADPAPYQAQGMACPALGILVLPSSFGCAASSARVALNPVAVITHANDWSCRMQTGGRYLVIFQFTLVLLQGSVVFLLPKLFSLTGSESALRGIAKGLHAMG